MTIVPRSSVDTHFGLAWNWDYDRDFTALLNRLAHERGLRSYLVGPHNLAPTIQEMGEGTRRFHAFLDRASDDDPRFLELHRLAEATGARVLNARHHHERSTDKALVHVELAARGLLLPLTVIIPPHEQAPVVDPAWFEPLPKPLVVKPARGGGGVGVFLGATCPEEIARARMQWRQQHFLLQQSIEPQLLEGRRAWFRVYHVCGRILPCWWDDQTHRYAVPTPGDAPRVNFDELTRIVRIIAGVAQLDFFSSEIALDRQGRYVVIDYVNDPCDMRLQSRHADGVPDVIVCEIAGSLIDEVARHSRLAPEPDAPDAAWWP